VSLVARFLEDNGISTVVLGSARDIVEYCGVPRFIFTDFPLGNPCGKPYDRNMQRQIVEMALELLENATEPRTTVQTPFIWSEEESWKEEYMKIDASNMDQLRKMGEQRRLIQIQTKEKGMARTD
jgi:D-proline reductase (dithiol) PrdB